MRKRITARAFRLMARGNMFVGHTLLSLDVRPVSNIPTAAFDVNGAILVNEEWAGTLSDDQLVGVVLHERLGWYHSAAFKMRREQPVRRWSLALELSFNTELPR